MIAYLQGKVLKKLAKGIIVDTGSIGYLVNVPTPLQEKLAEKSNLELYIHTKVREDDISLYGFENIEELDFFKLLMNVNGIGPKLALEILSQNLEKVKMAIMTSDLAFLTHIPGIGKKTAERIVIELKNSIEPIDLSRIHSGMEKAPNDEATEALAQLGYQRYEITRILKDLPDNIKSTEEIITYFLRNV